MDGSKNSYENQVQAYKQKLTKYESVIKEKEAEYEAERSKLPKLRKRSLGEIKNEIQELRNDLWRSKPKKKCPDCNKEIDYDNIVCWHCGEVFLNVCPKCKSQSVNANEWGLLRCPECDFEYRELDLLEDLLIGCADPNYRYFRVLNSRDIPALNCYNIGIRNNPIWDLCKNYNCPFDEKCEYYCPAFLSILALIWRGKVSTGLPWGEYQGGDAHGYKIRWKRRR